MRVVPRSQSPYEMVMSDIEKENIDRARAILDYNIMMGNIEDPMEEDEEDE